jgi:hypothetical protein
MPASYRIDGQRRTIFSSAVGLLVDADMRRHQRDLLSDPEFDSTFDQLWDLRGVERNDLTGGLLRDLSKVTPFARGVKRALVAPSDIDFGMARMFQLLHDHAPEEVRVFRTMEEAEAWLGLV